MKCYLIHAESIGDIRHNPVTTVTIAVKHMISSENKFQIYAPIDPRGRTSWGATQFFSAFPVNRNSGMSPCPQFPPRQIGKFAQQRPRVARVDDILDAELFGGAERRGDLVELGLDLR